MTAIFAAVFLLFSDSPVDAYYDEMVSVRRHLHQFPELSNRETQTQAYLRSILNEAGFSNISELAGTGLKVVYDTGKPGPTIAFRADIDALPVSEETKLPYASKHEGVMHACGHDIHTGILFGTALAIRDDPNLTGIFVFLFQPAEEGPPPGEEGGAAAMIADGALEQPRPNVIFGLHGMGWLPLGSIGMRRGGIMSRADRFFLTIKGKQTHGSTPQNGVDAIYVASQVIEASQSVVSRHSDPRDPIVVSFGEFHAGRRFNIIPGEAKLSGTIRTLDPETGDRVPQLLDQVIAGITSAHGATYVFENETMCPSLQNDLEWNKRAEDVLSESFSVQEVKPVMAAEDFAFYAERIPAVYFFLGTCGQDRCANIHEPTYAPAEKSLRDGAHAFFLLAKAFSQNRIFPSSIKEKVQDPP